VVAKDYKIKGEYITAAGMKTCITVFALVQKERRLIGPSDTTGDKKAAHGILVIYDIFGFFPQTLQGADILAAGDHERPYRVVMPDFFDGHPADISWYPPDTKEKGEKLGEFFNGPAKPPKTLERIPKVLEAMGKEYPDIKVWVILATMLCNH
jgi:hypothetical protein